MTTARQITVKAIASVAVNIATLRSLMSSPPSRANDAPISANDVPTAHVAIASIAANVRMPKIRGRRVSSHTTPIVSDEVKCGITPGRARAPSQVKSGENAASRPKRSGRKLKDSRPFQNAKIARRSWKNSRPCSVSRPPDEIAIWKCDRDPDIRGV